MTRPALTAMPLRLGMPLQSEAIDADAVLGLKGLPLGVGRRYCVERRPKLNAVERLGGTEQALR